jgi:ribosomal protein S18 acetylase RimI-like enzyme
VVDPTGAKEDDRVLTGGGRPAPAGPSKPNPHPHPQPPIPPVVRISRDLELTAAARLVGDAQGAAGAGARRMVTAAAIHGIDLSWMWGTVDRGGGGRARVRQVCLVVPGSGRTAMCILSGPGLGSPDIEHAERVACLRAACLHLQQQCRAGGRDIRLAQALPEPAEEWAVCAYLDAGFVKVGDLAYLRRARTSNRAPAPTPVWPAGVTVRQVTGFAPDRHFLLEALDRSYEQTLDCPELCGLRETADVLESHRATGVFDPKLWWLVFANDQPHGCMLLNRCPEQGTVELVYLGLSPDLRGKGIGGLLLQMGLARIDSSGGSPMTCAVDLRNTPALHLYQRLGFAEFGRRVALVRPIPQ